jgi:hypothetical protein
MIELFPDHSYKQTTFSLKHKWLALNCILSKLKILDKVNNCIWNFVNEDLIIPGFTVQSKYTVQTAAKLFYKDYFDILK